MKKTILRKNNQMTRYSREEINKLLINNKNDIEMNRVRIEFVKEAPSIISQLLEENRILREGLGKIENNISIICAPINEAYILKEIARETTAKADEVGKEKG